MTVDTKKLRANMEAWGRLWTPKRALRETFGVRGAELKELLDVYEAAMTYANSKHTFDANCAAGECDSCTARVALEKLERLVGGPKGGHALPGKKVV